MLSWGCVSPEDLRKSTLNEAPTHLIPLGSGEKAVSIIFLASSSGSFDVPTASTVNTPGSGLQIQRIFRPNGTELASYADTDWPSWVPSVEIGISGPNNTAAPHQDCARFSLPAVDGLAKCDFNGDSVKDEDCGGPSRYLRVSELDCASGSTLVGNGGGSDGVYIRVRFDRNNLKPTENILAVLEYAASGLNSALASPLGCFAGGAFTPTGTDCSDHSYQVFLKRSASDVVANYVTVVPPVTGFVDTAKKRGGSKPLTREFLLPLASDSQLQYLQISRINGLPLSATDFTTRCGSNSPFCVGMVFYRLLLIRI